MLTGYIFPEGQDVGEVVYFCDITTQHYSQNFTMSNPYCTLFVFGLVDVTAARDESRNMRDQGGLGMMFRS
jgi:hypothetical protein